MINFSKGLCFATLVLGGAIGTTAIAQTTQAPVQVQAETPSAAASSSQSTGDVAPPSSMNPNDSSTYATGQPLQQDSKEGFWGHMNPFARKKWVKREVDPVKDRVNELDQLQAKNANDIRDVDNRATAGINKAMMAANAADSHAGIASSKADAAQSTANMASTRTDALNGTVSNLDQYKEISSADIPFAAGRTTLGPKGRADLDDVATKLNGEKGYIIEIQGYSRGGIATSQAMADSVARYLVLEHQVPIYRIYRTGLGRDTEQATDGERAVVNGVRVTLMHNSLASMGTSDNPSNVGEAAAAPSPTVNP